MTEPQNRRRFLKTTTAAAIAAPHIISASALGLGEKPAASDRIQIGLIGAGGMGRANLDHCAKYPDVEVAGVCDVWKERRDAVVAKYWGAKPYADHREILASDQVDAVIIATPPHWHCLLAVAACEAGKDWRIR